MKLLKYGLVVAAFLTIQTKYATGQNTVDSMPQLQGNPTLQVDAMFYDAVKARLKNDDKEAEQLFTEVIKQKPDAAAAYYELSRLKFKQYNAPKATEYIKKAVELDGTNAWYKAQYAEILALSNKYAEAADVYVALAKQEKYNDDYLRKAVQIYQTTGKYKEAIATLNLMLEKDPKDEQVLAMKQQLYLKMNDVDGAVKVAQQLISYYPEEGKYYAILAEIYDNNKMPGNAVEIYRKMEQQFGDDPLVQLSLAEYYRKKEDQQQYNAYVKRVFTNKGLDADTKLALLGQYVMENSADSTKRRLGIEMTAEVAKVHSDNAKVLAFYGDVLALNNEIKLAVDEYKKSLALDASNYKVWESLLFGYTDRENVDSLLFYSEKALKLFPNQAMLHYLNGVGHTNKRNYPAAIKALNRAVDMMPDEKSEQLARLYMALGDAYNFNKQYALSDSSYEKAMRLEPLNPSVLNNYSYYLSVRGVRLDDAEKMSKKSLELAKDEPTFLDTYGWILYKQGKYEKAREYIQKAIDLSAENADGTLWEHLGDVHYKLGDTEKAVACWIKAKEKGTDNTDIDKKIKDRKLYEA